MGNCCCIPLGPVASNRTKYCNSYCECDHHEKSKQWMKSLPDSTRISMLSIPGTHDSCTYNKGCCSCLGKIS